jgi:hypothetical protein
VRFAIGSLCNEETSPKAIPERRRARQKSRVSFNSQSLAGSSIEKGLFFPMVANRMCIIQPRKLDTLSISFDETFLY